MSEYDALDATQPRQSGSGAANLTDEQQSRLRELGDGAGEAIDKAYIFQKYERLRRATLKWAYSGKTEVRRVILRVFCERWRHHPDRTVTYDALTEETGLSKEMVRVHLDEWESAVSGEFIEEDTEVSWRGGQPVGEVEEFVVSKKPQFGPNPMILSFVNRDVYLLATAVGAEL